MANPRSTRIFYGWWIVVATFLNLFFAVGIIFYGFPVFYPAFVESLGFTRAQVTQGFLLGFLVAGLPFGFLAGVGRGHVRNPVTFLNSLPRSAFKKKKTHH